MSVTAIPRKVLKPEAKEVDTLRSEETQILASDRPEPDPNGCCQDTSGHFTQI